MTYSLIAIASIFLIGTASTGLFILKLLSSSKKLNRTDQQKLLKLEKEALALRERVTLLENNLNSIHPSLNQEKSS